MTVTVDAATGCDSMGWFTRKKKTEPTEEPGTKEGPEPPPFYMLWSFRELLGPFSTSSPSDALQAMKLTGQLQKLDKVVPVNYEATDEVLEYEPVGILLVRKRR